MRMRILMPSSRRRALGIALDHLQRGVAGAHPLSVIDLARIEIEDTPRSPPADGLRAAALRDCGNEPEVAAVQ